MRGVGGREGTRESRLISLALVAPARAWVRIHSQILDRLEQKAAQESVAPFAFVWVYMGLRDQDRAFEWLDEAYEVRDMDMIMLRVPGFQEGLAPEPRYIRLLQRMKLPTD